MVTKASEQLTQAIEDAQKRTRSEISVVIEPASDDYHEFVLFYGFILGSFIDIILWASATVTDFSLLLVTQAAVIIVMDGVPALRHLCIRLVPQKMLHDRAAKEAMRRYRILHAQIAEGTPYVLLYISIAEHYVHVLTNPKAHKKIPDHWQKVTNYFTATVGQNGVHAACAEAVRQIADILATQFPAIK